MSETVTASTAPPTVSVTHRLPHQTRTRDLVALVLAVGLAAAFFTITAAVMYDAVRSDTPGLSENATQILTGWGGGIIGVVGSYLGYRAGESERDRAPRDDPPPGDPPD
jgi:uncharacterized membrane protein YeiH